jgi:hypothetical protein
VARRIGARPRRRGARRTLLVTAALVLLLAAAAGAVQPVRDAVRDLLGIEGATVERVPRLPATPGGLDLGRPVPDAGGAGFTALVPRDPALGPPDSVHLRGRPPAAQLTFAYRAGPGLPELHGSGLGLLLTEFRGDLEPALVEKLLGPRTGTRRVRIAGARGFWIRGPHAFAYRDPEGNVSVDERRRAGNTLLWRRGPLLLRLESGLALRDARKIAETLTEAGAG